MTDARDPSPGAALPPVAPGIFRVDATSGEPVLLGGACIPCDRRFFPRPPICPGCLGEVTETSLGSQGTLYSYTVVRVKPPLGLPQPYAVGYVDLTDCGLRVFSLLDPAVSETFAIDQELELAVAALGHDGAGNACLRPYFTHVHRGPVATP